MDRYEEEAPHHEEGQQDNNNGGREEPPEHDVEDEDEQHVEVEDEPHIEEDADTRMPLTSVVRDPHLQEQLLKKPADARAAVREKSKLAQLEIDSTTPLYPGCKSEDTPLKVALNVLQLKARYKWRDASADACLQYWHDHLLDEITCPSTLDEAKKVVCPLDLPHERYHACINDCYIYRRKDDVDKTKCPVCDAPQLQEREENS
jgi:hypothetical protein